MIGASFGGGAAAEASAEAEPGEIDRLILLAHSPIDESERMKGRKLFILSCDDSSGDNKVARLPTIRDQYESARPEGVGCPRRVGPRPAHLRDGRRRATDARALRFLTAP